MKSLKKRSLLSSAFLIIVVSCSQDTDSQIREWASGKTVDADKNEENNNSENVDNSKVPFHTQDGSKILSRDSLGFERSTSEAQGFYQLTVTTYEDKTVREKRTANYYLVALDDKSENCRALVRKKDQIVFYDLDCIKTPEKSQSRYFDLGFTEDDLLVFGAKDCDFKDLAQEDKSGFSNSRNSRSNAVARATKQSDRAISALFHGFILTHHTLAL